MRRESPSFRRDAGFPINFRTLFSRNRPGRASHVKVLADHDSLGHQDHLLGLASPSPGAITANGK
jgi:hypothetical protein